MKNTYTGSIEVEFEKWPSLIPEKLKTDVGGPLESVRGASARRIFNLERDWEIRIRTLDNSYDEDVSGTIVIPKLYSKNSNPPTETRFDGASVPFPWLVSFLSFGVLRPLGVMFIASVVHDFAFEYGGLLYGDDVGVPELRKIRRDVADKLFYDIIKTVNNMPFTGLLAWLAVRLGWFWVPYGDKRYGGKFPSLAVIILVLVLLILGLLIKNYGIFSLISGFTVGYLLIFLLLKLTSPSAKRAN